MNITKKRLEDRIFRELDLKIDSSFTTSSSIKPKVFNLSFSPHLELIISGASTPSRCSGSHACLIQVRIELSQVAARNGQRALHLKMDFTLVISVTHANRLPRNPHNVNFLHKPLHNLRLRVVVTSLFYSILLSILKLFFPNVCQASSMRLLHSDRRSAFAIFRKILWLPNDNALEQNHEGKSIAHQHKAGCLMWYILPFAILPSSCAFALILRFAFLHARYI